MITQLTIHEFLQQSKQHLMVDVRSEGEFAQGHIPAAISLPLFSNEERKVIGTAYKQQGKEEAILLGLDIVGPKMSRFIKFVQPLAKDNKIFVHCWRGGMRSGSMAWLFNQFGFDVYVLTGGYKSYRQHVLQWLNADYKYVVLGGKTGSGKTQILTALKSLNEQVLDLEELANHRGSAFGGLGKEPQPSTEHFENLTAEQLKTFNIQKRVWIEDESRTIGKVFLDINFWKKKCDASLFVIDLPQPLRVQNLLSEYGLFTADELKKSFEQIVRRLGNEQCKTAVAALEENNFKSAAEIALHYYDKAYEKGIALKETPKTYTLSFKDSNIEQMAQQLIQQANARTGY